MKRIYTYVKKDINISNNEPGMRRKCQFYRYFKEQEPHITWLIGKQITTKYVPPSSTTTLNF